MQGADPPPVSRHISAICSTAAGSFQAATSHLLAGLALQQLLHVMALFR